MSTLVTVAVVVLVVLVCILGVSGLGRRSESFSSVNGLKLVGHKVEPFPKSHRERK